jgi:hypothetical protein
MLSDFLPALRWRQLLVRVQVLEGVRDLRGDEDAVQVLPLPEVPPGRNVPPRYVNFHCCTNYHFCPFLKIPRTKCYSLRITLISLGLFLAPCVSSSLHTGTGTCS